MSQLPAYQSPADYHILLAIGSIYADLTPENLSHDGELPPSQVQSKRAKLQTKLENLFAAYGQRVTEGQVFEWERALAKKQQERMLK